MNYDSDRRKPVLERVRDALDEGDLKQAMQLLRHASAGGAWPREGGLFAGLKSGLGIKHVAELVEGFADEVCPYCKGGRTACEDCEGHGHVGEASVCRPCAGLGLRRCLFCNGTSRAGYDFVPAGLRPAVMLRRLKHARHSVDHAPGHEAHQSRARELARRLLELDRDRGIAANAAEQVRLNGPGSATGRGVYSATQVERVRHAALEINHRAEGQMHALLRQLSEEYASRAEHEHGPALDGKRRLSRERAKFFGRLAGEKRFGSSELETPRSLRLLDSGA